MCLGFKLKLFCLRVHCVYSTRVELYCTCQIISPIKQYLQAVKNKDIFGALAMAQQDRQHLGSTRTRVQSLP